VGRPRRRTITLGPWGSEKADKELARIIAERKASTPTETASAGDITVNEFLLAYKKHAERHYRHPNGGTARRRANSRTLSACSCTPGELYG